MLGGAVGAPQAVPKPTSVRGSPSSAQLPLQPSKRAPKSATGGTFSTRTVFWTVEVRPSSSVTVRVTV